MAFHGAARGKVVWVGGFRRTFSFSPNSLLLGVLNALKNGRLGAGWSGRVPGRLVSHFLSFVSQFFSFVSQAGRLWSGSRLACLPLPFICLPLLFNCLPVLFTCLPGWVLVVGFPAGLSPTSFHLSPSSFHLSPKPLPFICLQLLFIVSQAGACGRVPGRLVSHFLSSPTSFHLSPRLGGRVPGRLVSHFLSFVSYFFSACGRVPGRVVSHFLLFVSHFFSFVSQAGCLWSGSRPACLPLAFICLPVLFIFCRVPGRLVSHFLECVSHFFSFVSQAGCLWSGSRLACLPLPCISPISFYLSPASFHLSPRLGACSPVSGRLVSHFLAFVFHFFPKQFTVRGSQFFLKTCPPFVSLLVSAHFHWPCNISIHPSPRSVTVGARPFPLAMQHFYSCVSQVCH